jgi:ethanolaminephosphotransferase
MYQTLDAIDGKQARRTGAASPLGQLFDHGCDAIVTPIAAYAIMSILRIGDSPTEENDFRGAHGLVMMFYASIVGGFWFANWEEYHTGILRCTQNGFGLTDLQCGIMALMAM